MVGQPLTLQSLELLLVATEEEEVALLPAAAACELQLVMASPAACPLVDDVDDFLVEERVNWAHRIFKNSLDSFMCKWRGGGCRF